MQDFQRLLRLLVENEVRFVIIGGFAAVAHGSTLLTEDVDVCIPFDLENMERLLTALESVHPEHRLIGRRRALTEGAERLSAMRNLYLRTDVGYVDFLSEVSGVGGFDQVMERSVEMPLFDLPCRVLTIDALIASKKAMRRPKDAETVIQLEAIKGRTDLPTCTSHDPRKV